MAQLLLAAAAVQAKHTITLQQERPVLKAPSVTSSNFKKCLYQDALNYACIDTTVSLKAGWDITQSWTTATDINPTAPSPLYTGALPAFTYSSPDVTTDVGYKYKLRFAPYQIFFFNTMPEYKLDMLIQQQAQVNINKFKSMVYFEIVYYQKAIKQAWTGTNAATHTVAQPDPTSTYTAPINDKMYTLLGIKYPGKLCFDMGYNTQALLLKITQSISWRDCYKNVFKTFTDWSNWVGPKAMWLDFCDFASSQDMLLYTLNPWGISADTGDQSFLQ